MTDTTPSTKDVRVVLNASILRRTLTFHCNMTDSLPPQTYFDWFVELANRLAAGDTSLFCLEPLHEPKPEPELKPKPRPKAEPKPVDLSTVRAGDQLKTKAGRIFSRDDGEPVVVPNHISSESFPYRIIDRSYTQDGLYGSTQVVISREPDDSWDIVEIIRADGEG